MLDGCCRQFGTKRSFAARQSAFKDFLGVLSAAARRNRAGQIERATVRPLWGDKTSDLRGAAMVRARTRCEA
jgi:hypothetical protein